MKEVRLPPRGSVLPARAAWDSASTAETKENQESGVARRPYLGQNGTADGGGDCMERVVTARQIRRLIADSSDYR